MVGLPGPDLDAVSARRLEALAPAGVIVFRRNLETPERLSALLGELRRILRYPLLLAIDQEGGRVSRLAPWIGETPSGERLARTSPQSIHAFAAATAAVLRALGFNLDFAPVVDLCGPEVANGIGDRSFGTRADEVAVAAGAFLDGLQEAGVAGCLKHFPGLGPTSADTHAVLPEVAIDRSSIEEHLRPFRALAPRAAAIMVSHAHYPALDPERGRPASQSPPLIEGLLRGELALASAGDRDPRVRERILAAAGAVARAAERWPAPPPSPRGFELALREIREAATLA
jgi:beta-N-acetylhexosaminidase